MQTHILFVAIAIMVLASCGTKSKIEEQGHGVTSPQGPQAPAAKARPVYGDWKIPGDLELAGTKFSASYHIESDKVSAVMDCTYADGKTLTASATSAADVTDDKIKVKETQEMTTQQGEHQCNVKISPEEMSYKVSGTQLVLTRADGKSMTLTKK